MVSREYVTASNEFRTYEITRELGIAHGISVRSRSVIGNAIGGIQQIFGGNISVFTQLCEDAREEAFQKMLAHAASLGANAIVAFRFDSNELADGVSEVLAYGTAVVIEGRR
jgi:uncharacterized protein YbjQ (UPF0145 family)